MSLICKNSSYLPIKVQHGLGCKDSLASINSQNTKKKSKKKKNQEYLNLDMM
jgi:hypothetical protein